MNEQGAQFQVLVVLVLEGHGVEAGLERSHGERGLSDEVGISEHVLVLGHEPDQGQLRVEDLEFTALVPYRVEPVVLWRGKDMQIVKYLCVSEYVCVCVCACLFLTL